MKKERLGKMQIVMIILLVITAVMSLFPIGNVQAKNWNEVPSVQKNSVSKEVLNPILFSVGISVLQVWCIIRATESSARIGICLALVNALYTSRIFFLAVDWYRLLGCMDVLIFDKYKVTWNGYLLGTLLWVLAVLLLIYLKMQERGEL